MQLSDKEALETILEFRAKVDEYLYLGYSSPQWEGISPEGEHYRNLRREINEAKGLVHEIISEFNVGSCIDSYPPSAIGGPVYRGKLVDMITNNMTYERIEKQTFLDMFDATIGELKRRIAHPIEKVQVKPEREAERVEREKSNANYWNWINPFWLIWQLLLCIKRFWQWNWLGKIIIGLIPLVAIDYSLAWQNITSLINFVVLLFNTQ